MTTLAAMTTSPNRRMTSPDPTIDAQFSLCSPPPGRTRSAGMLVRKCRMSTAGGGGRPRGVSDEADFHRYRGFGARGDGLRSAAGRRDAERLARRFGRSSPRRHGHRRDLAGAYDPPTALPEPD